MAAVMRALVYKEAASAENFGAHFYPVVYLTLFHRSVLKCQPPASMQA